MKWYLLPLLNAVKADLYSPRAASTCAGGGLYGFTPFNTRRDGSHTFCVKSLCALVLALHCKENPSASNVPSTHAAALSRGEPRAASRELPCPETHSGLGTRDS